MLPCRSLSLRRQRVGIDSGKDAPFARIVHFCPMGARWPVCASLPSSVAEPGAGAAVSPRRCRPGTSTGRGKHRFPPSDTPPLPSLAPVGRQGRSGINSEASSGFMPHQTLRPPGSRSACKSPPPSHPIRNNRLESGAWKRLDTSPALVGARRQLSPALSKGGLLGLDEPEARSFSPRPTADRGRRNA